MMIWFSGKESSEKLPRILREKMNFEPSQTIIVQRLTYSIAAILRFQFSVCDLPLSVLDLDLMDGTN